MLITVPYEEKKMKRGRPKRKQGIDDTNSPHSQKRKCHIKETPVNINIDETAQLSTQRTIQT